MMVRSAFRRGGDRWYGGKPSLDKIGLVFIGFWQTVNTKHNIVASARSKGDQSSSQQGLYENENPILSICHVGGQMCSVFVTFIFRYELAVEESTARRP